MIRRPPRSTPFPTRRSSDLVSWTALLCTSLTRPRWRTPACSRLLKKSATEDRKSTRLNSSHVEISYAVFCMKKKKKNKIKLHNKLDKKKKYIRYNNNN